MLGFRRNGRPSSVNKSAPHLSVVGPSSVKGCAPQVSIGAPLKCQYWGRLIPSLIHRSCG
ncbi:hypothetical protein BXL72_21860 [Salmonella enterica subsp. enterica serovar Enteritidis]|nr:hypothetical protein [Salmonella enterica subsp. enterica serovar Enteritidis]